MEAQGGDTSLLPPREAAVASLDSAAQYLTRIRTCLERASGLFRAGDLGEANQLYARVLDGLHVLVFALTASGRVIGGSGAALCEVEREVEPCVAELLAAQERRDWISVADALEYELHPLLDTWANRVGEVKDRVAMEEGAKGGARDAAGA